MEYKELFKKLGNPNPICFADYKIMITVDDIPKYNNKYDITFVPNIGGTTDTDITEFKAFWVDIDAGKDENNNYFSGKIVKEFKSKQWEKIYGFAIQPNIVTETRNGFHLMWFLKEKISVELWRRIETALTEYFDGDKSVCCPSNQLRVPGTMWRKDPQHPYPCKILKQNDNYTYIASYCDVLNISESTVIEKNNSRFRYTKPTTPKSKPSEPKVITNYKQMFDYLTKDVDMFSYLQEFYGLEGNSPRSFKCIIHDDKHPSASIFKVDSGVELYCCNATSCNFKGNIIQVVAMLEGCSRSDAITKICRNLNIEYKVDSKLEALLRDNINTIKDDIKNSHTELHSTVYRYLPTLRELHEIAIDNLEYAKNENKFLFTASINHIAQQLGRRDKKNTTADIGFLCLLKMIEKVDLETDSDVPKEFERYIRKFQGTKDNYITIFSIPYYSHTVLNECEDVARQIKAKGLRKAHFSYETVANAFGKETADRVFPQIKGKSVKEIDTFLVRAMENLIEKDGYFTLNTLKSYYADNGVFFKEKTYIRQLPAIMQQLNLEKVKASKKIKEEYGILSAGFPYLFRKKS